MDAMKNIESFLKLLTTAKLIEESDESLIIKEIEDKKIDMITATVNVKKLEYSKIAEILSQKFLLNQLDLDFFNTDFIPKEVPAELIDQYKFLPLKKNPTQLSIAISNPFDPLTEQAREAIKFRLGLTTTAILVEENKLKKVISNYLQSQGVGFNKQMADVDMNMFEEDEDESAKQEAADNEVEDEPVVKFVHKMLLDAVQRKASDIHFEPYENTYRVRYRMDGVLTTVNNPPANIKHKVASRIKVMSNLDISEKRVPQDGRYKMQITKDKAIDFRISTLPTIWGEKIVLRILDSSAASLDIDRLGYDPEQKAALMEAVARPYGMVLVTGPTGSGKTVSLYSCLNVLNKDDVNICTAEDPAEINLPGVNQVNMNEKAGLTFAATLKSFLRQDPDTILVGEIRDLETADIAIKAAQTGHMVLSTLHTNDAPKTITRLMNMGVAPFSISSAVILITAQRLARRLCECKAPIDNLPEDILLKEGMDPQDIEGLNKTWKVYKPVGCDKCEGKGYKGRVGIYQVMPITEKIRKIILNKGTDIEIAAAAREDGVYGLREAGLKKVKLGITSLEEVLATTNLD